MASNGKELLRKPRLYHSCSAKQEEEEEVLKTYGEVKIKLHVY